jgi:hypothetical protein
MTLPTKGAAGRYRGSLRLRSLFPAYRGSSAAVDAALCAIRSITDESSVSLRR